MQPFDSQENSRSLYSPDSNSFQELPQASEQDTAESSVTPEAQKAPRRPSVFGKLFSLFFILLCLGVVGTLLFGNAMLSSSTSLARGRESEGFFGSLSQIGSLLNFTRRDPLLGESSGRTNFLILGRDNTPQGLTDTIILVSYDYATQTLATLNIPRDFYIFDGFQASKVNAVYANAEQRNPGSGEQFLVSVLEKELEQPIHYWASVEFESVEALVDALGGVEVEVENAFTDYNYPDKQYGYLTPAPSFEVGTRTMDGETALIYARSRNGNNPVESGDFARSRRQSVVLEAILETLRSRGILGNARQISEFYQIAEEYVVTNLRAAEIVSLGTLLKNVEEEADFTFSRAVLSDEGGILCPQNNPGTGYILTYCDGSSAGRSGVSTSRSALREKVAELTTPETVALLPDATLAIVGNQSSDIDIVYNDLVNDLGLVPDFYNRSFPQITPATATSVEQTTIYVADSTLRQELSQTLSEEGLSYNLTGEIPTAKPLPSGFESADIIVYVESR